jgi:predicted 3-demethylubiquinone-9 3-methyltransferase (glyoxalase superfamily)
MNTMQKITPFLWFDNNAEDAVVFYTAIFPNSRIVKVSTFGDSGPGPRGAVISVTFEINGLEIIALNGGPQYTFSPAISLFVKCDTQEEIDRYWERLSDGGEKLRCGWLRDKFGVSWQVIPEILGHLINDPDPNVSQRSIEAMLQMNKIDIAKLEAAAHPSESGNDPA